MRFFQPTDAFLDWAGRNLRRRAIFDVGAGEGHVTEFFAARDLTTVAIDILPHEDARAPVIPLDGGAFPYPPGAVVLLCRPCHGIFAERVIRRAIARGAAAVLYVGLVKNVRSDLGAHYSKFEEVLDCAGEDGEKVWKMGNLRAPKKTPVALVKTAFWNAPYWVEETERYWVNVSGGRCPRSPDDVVLERTEIEDEDFQSLDWTKTGQFMADGDYGWLSPAGIFYACEYQEHADLAYYIIKKEVRELEAEKWVRIDGPGERKKRTFRLDGEPTAAQRAWLLGRGHDLDPSGSGEAPSLVDEERDAEAFEREVGVSTETYRRNARPLRTGD